MVRDRSTAAAEGSVWGRLKTPSLVIRLIFLRLVCLVVLSEGSVNAWCPLIFVTTCFLICSSSALNLKKPSQRKPPPDAHLMSARLPDLNVLLFLFCSFLVFFLTLNQTKCHHTRTCVIAQEKQKDLPAHVLQTSLVRRLPAVIQPLNWCFSNPEVFSTRRFPARRLNSISPVFYTQACRRYKSLHARKLPWIGFIEEIMCFHLNAFQRNFLVCVISVFVAPCFLNPGPAKVCVRGLVCVFT